MWIEVNVRGLVAREASGFRDWGVSVSLRCDPAASEATREVRVGHRLGLLRQERMTLGREGRPRESQPGGTRAEHGVTLNLAPR